MKPNLIILNGPLGIGKSTLAKRYAEDHPLTLILDIDDVWAMLSHWRQEKEKSAPLSKQMAMAMARINLMAGNDVMIPLIVQTSELANDFERLAKECKASFYEILLNVDKGEALRRFIERGKSEGHPSGFRAGGIIDTNGRDKKLAEMYDNMMEIASTRSHIITVEPISGDVEKTYAKIVGIMKLESSS